MYLLVVGRFGRWSGGGCQYSETFTSLVPTLIQFNVKDVALPTETGFNRRMTKQFVLFVRIEFYIFAWYLYDYEGITSSLIIRELIVSEQTPSSHISIMPKFILTIGRRTRMSLSKIL